MVDLNLHEKKIYDAVKKLGAVDENTLKSADDILKSAQLGKALVTSSLQSLAAKGYIKRELTANEKY